MFRLLLPGAAGLVVLALWIYCILDVIATEDYLVRSLPKGIWLLLVIFLPTVGSVAWLLLGRPMYAGWQPGDTRARRRPSAGGPEDDASWSPPAQRTPDPSAPVASPPAAGASGMSAEDLKAWEDDLRRREEELRRRQQGDEGFEGFRW